MVQAVDGVALASVITSGIVAVVGLGFAIWNARRERETRHSEVESARQHERELARDARLFESRRTLYGEVAELVAAYMDYAIVYHPAHVKDPMASMPAGPETVSVRRYDEVAARMSTYGSRRADQALDAFKTAFDIFRGELGIHLEARRTRASENEVRRTVESARQAFDDLEALAGRVKDVMRRDLEG